MLRTRDFSTTHNFRNSKVDTENGVLKNVLIAQQGLNKNGSLFDRPFLKSIAELGNSQPKGVKSRFGHPGMCSESLGTYIGRYHNFSVKNKAVYADLYLDEITKETQVSGAGISQWDYITKMASSNPDMFGNSIVVGYKEMTSKLITNSEGEEIEVDYFVPTSLPSSDLVDDPAATDALFDTDNLGVKITSFLDSISDEQKEGLFKTVQSSEKIKEFINRYTNNKNNMGLFEKVFGAEKKEVEVQAAPTFTFSEENYNEIISQNSELKDQNKALAEKLADLESNFSEDKIWALVQTKFSQFSEGLEGFVNEKLDEFAKNTKSDFKVSTKTKEFEPDNTDQKPFANAKRKGVE